MVLRAGSFHYFLILFIILWLREGLLLKKSKIPTLNGHNYILKFPLFPFTMLLQLLAAAVWSFA